MGSSMFDALAELVSTTQLLIKDGWVFEYNHYSLIAKKEDRQESTSNDVIDFLEYLCNIERRKNEDKLITWLKEHNGLCPNCKIAPPINTFKCSKCGWKL